MNCKLLIAFAIIGIIAQVVIAAKLQHAAALEELRLAGIQVKTACANNTRLNASCVSLEQINSQTIQGVKGLKASSECDTVVVIGGTEIGHVNDVDIFSHKNGYKIDLQRTACLDNYIRSTFDEKDPRASDGALIFVSVAGNIYAQEKLKWDICYVK